jgi:hypothetical protein
MAKQKSNTGNELHDHPEETGAGTGNAGVEPHPEINPATEENQEKELTPFTEGILKMYPMYEFLYIDSQGGCYTQGTAESIRGGAIFYKNPFYK